MRAEDAYKVASDFQKILTEETKEAVQLHIKKAADAGHFFIQINHHPTNALINWLEDLGYKTIRERDNQLFISWAKK